ncbi:TonB-dependent receptor [soil metagenome]
MRASLDCAGGRSLITILALLVIAAGSAPSAEAQTDVIRGRVTDTNGQPLAGVHVTATSLPGSVVRSSNTNSQGNFQIVFPGGPGDYIMGYGHFGFAFRQLQVKRLADEAVLIADVRLAPVQLDSLLVNATMQQRVNRNQPTPDVSGTEHVIAADQVPPELQGDIAAMAASLPGVLLVPGLDGAADAFSVLGLDADQNSVTLNGMQMGADGLPRDAGVSSSLTTSPFDVARGGFSGGNFNISTRSGSNFRSRGSSLVLTTPQLQWTDRAAHALGTDYTNASLSGMAAGPLSRNKAFYNVSYQLGRQSRQNQTLLSTNALGLQTAGVAADSVNRFVGILGGVGLPTHGGPSRNSRVSDSGSLFGSIDLAPPSSASGQSYNLTLNGNWRRQTPVGSGATQLASTGGDQTNWSGGLQARHSAYVRMLLSETSAGISLSRDRSEPYLMLPAGRVRVNSVFEDGGSGVQTLSFGGNQSLGSSAGGTSATFQNSLSWFDNANRHRLKLSTEVQYTGNTRDQSSNLLGSFFFNSLEELEAGRAAFYSRTLTTQERSAGQLTGSVALGDSYRRTDNLQLQYGLRLDAVRYTTSPPRNPLVESTFGLRNDRMPTPLLVSPRIGFSWIVGRAQEIETFVGAARTPRATIRGGVGVFANSSNTSQLGNVMDNTGLPGGVQQLMCVGPAVPFPDWAAYTDPAAVPDQCADGTGGTVFSNPAPNVTLFADGWAPQRNVRSNLSWNGAILDARFSMNLEGTYSVNLNQQRTVDLNFDASERFTLADGRPVFVNMSSIVPATGSIASRDARVSQSFARVTELRSDLQSRAAQLSVRLSPISRGPATFGWSAAYTYSHIREEVSGFSSTAGDPLHVEWARSAQGPHQVSYSLRYRLFNAIQLNWNGSFRSGSAFTPMIAGDVNGDGYSNDRAFVHATSGTADPALAEGMRQLLENSTGSVRRCLEKQIGTIAARNSCRGPWSSTASLNATLDRAKFRLPQRTALSFSVSNPLGAADLALNGAGNLKGWGQRAFPDQSLLHVRGFDPQTRQYRFEVNQRFGATRPQFMTLRTPVMITASMRVDLGPTRERQNLSQQLSAGRSQPGSRFPESLVRSSATGSVLNPMATILRSQDSLQLTSFQADSIAAMNRRYTYRADSLWTPVARHLASLPDRYDERAAYDSYITARHAQIDMLSGMIAAVRELLTAEQRRKLPVSVVNLLDPRHLALIRNGTGMYISGVGLGPVGGAPPMMSGEFESMVIFR